MKKLIFILLVLFVIPTYAHNKKDYLPFARKGKYGKYSTRKNKPMKQHYYWTFAQWGR